MHPGSKLYSICVCRVSHVAKVELSSISATGALRQLAAARDGQFLVATVANRVSRRKKLYCESGFRLTEYFSGRSGGSASARTEVHLTAISVQFLTQIQLHDYEKAQRISTRPFAYHLQWNMGCMIRPAAYTGSRFIFHKSRFIHNYLTAISVQFLPQIQLHEYEEAQRISTRTFAHHLQWNMGCMIRPAAYTGSGFIFHKSRLIHNHLTAISVQFLPQIQLHEYEEARRISTRTFAHHLQWNMGCMIRPVAYTGSGFMFHESHFVHPNSNRTEVELGIYLAFPSSQN